MQTVVIFTCFLIPDRYVVLDIGDFFPLQNVVALLKCVQCNRICALRELHGQYPITSLARTMNLPEWTDTQGFFACTSYCTLLESSLKTRGLWKTSCWCTWLYLFHLPVFRTLSPRMLLQAFFFSCAGRMREYCHHICPSLSAVYKFGPRRYCILVFVFDVCAIVRHALLY